MDDNHIYKETEQVINITAESKATVRTNITVYSYDKNTAKFLFRLTKNSAALPMSNSAVISIALNFGTSGKAVLDAVVEDELEGLVSMVIPEEFLGYEGTVTGGVYINYSNGQSLDCGYFTFSMKRSMIDELTPEMPSYYVEGFENLRVEINEKSEEMKAQLSELDTVFKDLDVYNKAQVDSKVNGLKPAIDEVTAQLAQNSSLFASPIENGFVKLPDNFPEIPFNVYRKSEGLYYTDAKPENVFDWSGATEVFISQFGTGSGLGTVESEPIQWIAFVNNITSGTYGDNNLILNILEDVLTTSYFANLNNKNILIRSKSPSGFSWLSRLKMPGNPNIAGNGASDWVAEASVFKLTQSSTHEAVDVVNPVDTDHEGMPIPYKKVSSLSACQSEKGTFYQEDTSVNVYCNPHKGHRLKNIGVCAITNSVQARSATGTIVFENVGFVPESYVFKPTSTESQLYFFGCKFFHGKQDAFAIENTYQVYMIDCIAAYGSKDGFNYHTYSKDSLAVEINCVSYGNGLHKMLGGNTTTHSNNASTAHDGMNIVRFGGRYYDSEGPIIADVNNCYSINFEPNIGSVIESATEVKAGIHFDDSSRANRPDKAEKYVIGATIRYGHNEIGVNASTTNTHEAGVKGNRKFEGSVISHRDFEEILSIK